MKKPTINPAPELCQRCAIMAQELEILQSVCKEIKYERDCAENKLQEIKEVMNDEGIGFKDSCEKIDAILNDK